MKKLDKLLSLLEKIWSKDTSYQPNRWTVDKPFIGQCAVTALLIQDIYGGEIIQGFVADESHYWNKISEVIEFDATINQFLPTDKKVYNQIISRDELLSNENTRNRYKLLQESYASLLTKGKKHE